VPASIAAGATENENLYIYYGNPGASSASNLSAVFENLVAYWPLNYWTDPLVAEDVVGTNDGDLDFEGGTPQYTTGRFENYGYTDNALDFVGAEFDVVTISAFTENFASSGVTFTAWVWVRTTQEQTVIITKCAGAHWELGLGYGGTADDLLTFAACNAGGVMKVESTASVGTCAWYFVAGSYNPNVGTNGELRVYINGASVGYNDALPAVPNGEWPYHNNIGWRSTNNKEFDGVIDEIRVYARPLGLAEIQALYNRPSTSVGAEELAAAQWRLIETWTGAVSAPAEWNLVETWSAAVSAPAEWNLVETWSAAVSAPAEWHLVETWTGTVSAPPEWRLIESWSSTVNAPAEWYLVPLIIMVLVGLGALGVGVGIYIRFFRSSRHYRALIRIEEAVEQPKPRG